MAALLATWGCSTLEACVTQVGPRSASTSNSTQDVTQKHLRSHMVRAALTASSLCGFATRSGPQNRGRQQGGRMPRWGAGPLESASWGSASHLALSKCLSLSGLPFLHLWNGGKKTYLWEGGEKLNWCLQSVQWFKTLDVGSDVTAFGLESYPRPHGHTAEDPRTHPDWLTLFEVPQGDSLLLQATPCSMEALPIWELLSHSSLASNATSSLRPPRMPAGQLPPLPSLASPSRLWSHMVCVMDWHRSSWGPDSAVVSYLSLWLFHLTPSWLNCCLPHITLVTQLSETPESESVLGARLTQTKTNVPDPAPPRIWHEPSCPGHGERCLTKNPLWSLPRCAVAWGWNGTSHRRRVNREEQTSLHIESTLSASNSVLRWQPVLTHADSAPLVKECCLQPEIQRVACSQGSDLKEAIHREIKE